MRIQIFSDIHNDHKALKSAVAVEADYYIAAGDLVSWSKGLDECGEILRPLGEKLWVLPGNHETAAQITALCEKFGFRDFHAKSFEIGGRFFAGLGYSSPTPFDTPGEYSEEELAEKLAAFAELSPLTLICHAPPLGTPLDEAGPGRHFGSRAVKDFLDSARPERFFCGHVHEAAGRSVEWGPTRAMNVGKKGFLLEF